MIDPISQASIQSMLAVLRAHQAQASNSVPPGDTSASGQVASSTFLDAVQSVLTRVNDADTHAEGLAEAYERGEDVPLTDVVLGMQKASLAFEATLQVRNKVLKAYEDIMNMPV